MNKDLENRRVVAGMRSTGEMHLGHYHGVLKNWIDLQHKYDCFFFVADWHALTTHYDDPAGIKTYTWEMIRDWLAAGLNPGSCKIFIQSSIPEHAELHLLLSMITPLSWLHRIPTYKEQQEKLKNKDLSMYGFLGYPLLQSADVLIYKAGYVPVGEDQLAHLELARHVARRFNHLYGRGADFIEQVEAAIGKLGAGNAKLFRKFIKKYKEKGELEALAKGKALLDEQLNLPIGDKEKLQGFLEGTGKIILPEPEALLSQEPKFMGLDGQKMSKSYKNTIGLREPEKSVESKIKTMPTDPARIKRTDPGDPEKCPVWAFHKIYSNDEVKDWVKKGCTTAGIGCLECKKQVLDAILEELRPIRKKAMEYENNQDLIRSIVQEGTEEARDIAKVTLMEVRAAMGISYL